MKKVILVILALVLFSTNSVYADYDFEGNEDKYNKLCSQNNWDEDQAEVCRAYATYLAKKRSGLRAKLNDIEKSRKEVEENIASTGEKIQGLQNKINTLQIKIDELNVQIKKLQTSIDQLQIDIDRNTQEVAKLKKRVLERMVQMQKYMHFNVYLDFLLGADSFEDLISRSNGVKIVMRSDNELSEKLKKLIVKLSADKEKITQEKAKLDKSRDEVLASQQELVIERLRYEEIRIAYQKQEAELRESGNQIAGDLEATKKILSTLHDSIDSITTSDGWTQPLPTSVYFRSAGTWEYPGGGLHLGMDFAAPIGTAVVSPANGVVVHSYNGCDTWGYLGSMCGSVLGLGNQIRIVASVNDNLYGIVMGHFQADSVIESGGLIEAGDYVGRVGSSGSSTGPHTHVEIIYIGKEADFATDGYSGLTNYVSNWDGNLSFGAGWRTLSTTCDNNGYTPPCRMRPETIFLGW